MKTIFTLIVALFLSSCKQEINLSGEYALQYAPNGAEITLYIENNS